MIVMLLPITPDDYSFMLELRNKPEVARGSWSQRNGHIITWEEHLKWLNTRLTSIKIYTIRIFMERFGILSINNLSYWMPEVGVYIKPECWRLGYGKASLETYHQMLLDWGYKHCSACILDNNERSIRLFTKLGYYRIANARDGESLYRKDL